MVVGVVAGHVEAPTNVASDNPHHHHTTTTTTTSPLPAQWVLGGGVHVVSVRQQGSLSDCWLGGGCGTPPSTTVCSKSLWDCLGQEQLTGWCKAFKVVVVVVVCVCVWMQADRVL